MTVFENKKALSEFIEKSKADHILIGLVPTMGALHNGHTSLILQGLKENDLVVVSIFVNPTQFNNYEDLANYPRNIESDLNFLAQISKNKIVVYAPSVNDIYGDNPDSESFDFGGLEHEMEGKFRPGHFDGVGTIIKKLFKIIRPDTAYFGEKDYQQLMIVKKLAEIENLDVTVKGCEIYRAKDGLAMSSRNERLTNEQREIAPLIYKTLQTAKKKFGTESALEIKNWVVSQFEGNDILQLEYFLIANAKNLKTISNKKPKNKYRAFIAVYAGEVRLIDNIALN